MGIFRELGRRAERFKQQVGASRAATHECADCGTRVAEASEACPACGSQAIEPLEAD